MIRHPALLRTHYGILWTRALLGPGYLAEGQPFFRTLEDPVAAAALDLDEGQTLLEVGSGHSVLAAHLARRRACRVFSLEIELPGRWGAAIVRNRMRSARLAARGTFERLTGDARDLPLPDESCHRVLAVSSLEHLRERGDERAMAEVGRVLEPGGKAVVTVPLGWSGTVENEPSTHVPYFERLYSPRDLHSRLVVPSGLEVDGLAILGERWPGLGNRLSALPPALATRFGVLVSLVAPLCWTLVASGPDPDVLGRLPKHRHPQAGVVCLKLFKPPRGWPGPGAGARRD